MMQEHLFEPILNIVVETMPRDNLLNSACLEFFDFIKKEGIKTLITHLVENYREKMKTITYVETFSHIILRYDQIQGRAPMETSFLDTEEDTPKRPETGRGNRWAGIKDLDAAEEEYFNTSDDEEEASDKSPSGRRSMNGASPLRPLVDYPSDEETESIDIDTPMETPPDKAGPPTSTSDDGDKNGILTPSSSAAPPPPERVSEKRRREEDEEDELGKLAYHKRRNSSSSLGSNTGSALRRKKSLANSGHGSGAGAKPNSIAISISTASKTCGESTGGDGNGS